jgi:Spermine/spermidine synthase domain/S-adenosylmethionine decarboxylase
MMKEPQVDHHHHGSFNIKHGLLVQKQQQLLAVMKNGGSSSRQVVVVNISGSKMVMVLAIAVSLSFSFGRFCQPHLPFLQRVLQQQQRTWSSTTCSLQLPLISLLDLPEDNGKVLVDNDDSLHYLNSHDAVSSNGAEHLMVDVTNIDDPKFLSSPDLLEAMMLRIFQQDEHLNDEILSLTHANGLKDRRRFGGTAGGLSITALFLQSHAFLHAWPSTGVLTLDIYKSRRTRKAAWRRSSEQSSRVATAHVDDVSADNPKVQPSLVNLVPVIQSMFASKESENDGIEPKSRQPHVYWSIKDRGLDYDKDTSSEPSDSVDYKAHYLGRRSFTHKELVASVKTPLQTFEVFEMVDLRDLEQKKDRILFLDHVVQSSRFGLEAYHEALVHPALLAHPDPKRVAIIGGGEGATMREVLKHSTVEKVIMIEIDAAMVDASKIALLEWNDCSDLVGSADSCFDDPRAEIYLEDAVGWFIDRFNKNESISEVEKFDVIIMDAL